MNKELTRMPDFNTEAMLAYVRTLREEELSFELISAVVARARTEFGQALGGGWIITPSEAVDEVLGDLDAGVYTITLTPKEPK